LKYNILEEHFAGRFFAKKLPKSVKAYKRCELFGIVRENFNKLGDICVFTLSFRFAKVQKVLSSPSLAGWGVGEGSMTSSEICQNHALSQPPTQSFNPTGRKTHPTYFFNKL
jgi:hypothetical protein